MTVFDEPRPDARPLGVGQDAEEVQPKVRPLNSKVADFIRSALPPDLAGDQINRALDVVESPWPRREEVMLREWFYDDTVAGVDKSRSLIKRILSTGLEPFNQPEPLPPIGFQDVELVCWLAVIPELF